MALPPTIPTSFVPRAASAGPRSARIDFSGAFSFLAYLLLVAVIALAVGMFFYSRILIADKEAKDAELAKQEASIDSSTAQQFIRLNERLSSGQMLLNNHIAFSNFFSVIQSLIPVTVRFNNLHIVYNDTKSVAIDGTGVAKTFNALAATSASFAADGRIKDAVFSHIVINKDNSVSFSLSASLDQKIVAFTVAPTTPAAVTAHATSTSTSTTP